MDIKEYVTKFISDTDSPEKVYELFHGLKYPKDKVQEGKTLRIQFKKLV